MSGLVYPANLPGLTWGSTRRPVFNTGLQQALSGKESAIAYQQYPIMEWELQYELLRDYTTPSDLKALVGLFMAVGGKYDSFLYSDPEFNTVSFMPFATPDGVSTAFQTTANYQNPAGPGGAELIQNFNGVPVYYLNRYGSLYEQLAANVRTQYFLQSQTLSNVVWAKANCTVATSATQAPDGTLTATDMVNNTASNVQHYVAQTVTGLPAAAGNFYTFSMFYFNLGTLEATYITLVLQESTGATNAAASFNLATGATAVTAGANWSSVFATLTALGNGWFRASVTGTKTNAGTQVIGYCVGSKSGGTGGDPYAGVNAAKIATVWGFQLENAGLTMYLPTTTAAITQQDYTLGATGIITTTALLAAAGKLLWSGSFFYRVRFDDDSMTSTQFMKQFWENKRVKLRQRKL